MSGCHRVDPSNDTPRRGRRLARGARRGSAPDTIHFCYKGAVSERKYRHRGYQDSGRTEPKPRPPQDRPKPDISQGPRGRGLGAPTQSAFRCRVCGTKQAVVGPVGAEATCSSCGNDLHTCSNCVYFDGARPNECRKPVLVRIVAKTKRNTCELYAPNTIQEFASDAVAKSADPRAAFDALFRKK